jgi:hypothetical protein
MSSYGLVLLVLALLKDMNYLIHGIEYGANYTMWLGRAFTHFFSVYGDSNLFNETILVNGQLMFELSQDASYGS